MSFNREFANKLSAAIISNSSSCIHGLDLSHNLIEDRGLFSLKIKNRLYFLCTT